jgi:hypothetical protein
LDSTPDAATTPEDAGQTSEAPTPVADAEVGSDATFVEASALDGTVAPDAPAQLRCVGNPCALYPPYDGGFVAGYAGFCTGMAIHSDHLYVIEGSSPGIGQGVMLAIPVAGGAASTLASTNAAWGVAVGPSAAYWTSLDVNAGVTSVPLTGGAVRPIAPGDDYGIAVTSTSIYWLQENPGALLMAPLDGGAVATVVSGVVGEALAVSSTTAYWANEDPLNGGSVLSASLDGGIPVPLAPQNMVGAGKVAVDDKNVYWLDPQGLIERAIDGGVLTTLVTTTQGLAWGALAVDSSYVYWTELSSDLESSSVNKVPIGGGPAVTIATDPSSMATCLALDDNYVYWADEEGNVMKLAK